MKRDLDFISGNFLEYDVPKEKRYLLKYFKSELQQAFLRYFLVFGNHIKFSEHTGFHCHPRLVYTMEERLNRFMEAHEHAKKSMTEDGMKTLQAIEAGKFRLGRKKKISIDGAGQS